MHALESSAARVRNTLGCEPWLADILTRCLETEPDDRFPGPAAVADVLRRALVKPASAVDAELAAGGASRSGPSLPPFEVTSTPPSPVRKDPHQPVPPLTESLANAADEGPTRTRHGLLAAAGLAVVGVGLGLLGIGALQPSTPEARNHGSMASARGSMAPAERSAEGLAPVGLPTHQPSSLEPALDPAVAEPVDDPATPDEAAPPGEDPAWAGRDAAADLDRPSVDPADPGLTPEQRRAEAEQLSLEALAARRSGRTNDAIRLYKQALAVRPNHGTAYHALGTIYFNRQDYSAAIRYEKKAAQAQPKQSAYPLALGDYYFKSGDAASARKHWAKASRLGSRLAKQRLAEQ